MRLRFLICIIVYAVGCGIADRSGGSWLVYGLGSLMQVGSLFAYLRIAYWDGFRDGVDSVPLDGAGLASGDDRAFDDKHRWNAKLGAWGPRDHG